jgi:ACS family tartrate transporter-like MFS transporter
MILNALHSDHSGERYWHAAIPFVIISGGFLVAGLSMSPWLAVPALAAMYIGHMALQGPLLSLPSIFLKGRSMAGGIAAMNMVGMIGVSSGLTGWASQRTLRETTSAGS